MGGRARVLTHPCRKDTVHSTFSGALQVLVLAKIPLPPNRWPHSEIGLGPASSQLARNPEELDLHFCRVEAGVLLT